MSNLRVVAEIILSLLFLLILNQSKSFVECDKVRVVELVNSWILTNQNGSIQVNGLKIPSGVYSALSSQYGDVIDSKNDVTLRWIAYENWTYTQSFSVNQADYEHAHAVNLTFYGIDTVSSIRLNGQIIGTTNNMFVLYTFEVLQYLKRFNTLEIELMSPVVAAREHAALLAAKNEAAPSHCPPAQQHGECHRNMLRKMQMSFGSDCSLAAPSLGIWKTIALEYYTLGIMRDIDVAIRKNSDSDWIMDINIFINTGVKQNFYAQLKLFAPDLLDENPMVVGPQSISYVYPILNFQVIVPKNRAVEWWPNGYGQQKLYPLFFSLNCWLENTGHSIRSKSVSEKSLKIGFRTIELIEDIDDAGPEYGRTFYFKVNGYPIFVKGATYLPSHILPELSSDQDRIKHLLQSAQDAHMNMIRVWGGGLYQSDYFYSMADQYGLLVWQDMAFASATYPLTEDFVESVRMETLQNAKRLAYHPSLALIVTNDEIEQYLVRNKTQFGHDAERFESEYKQLFMGTIKYELKAISRNEYKPRPGPMLSTPSKGIEASKKELQMDPENPNFGDIHFWEDEKDGWNPDIYPRARFVSEYGFQSLPIMSSWNRAAGVDDNVADLIKHRQHDPKAFNPIMQLIERHLPKLAGDWENNIEKFIYFSQVAQAMAAKTATEVFRGQRAVNRTMGAIYWHLNDAWLAPSWSSIDFYGNYKIVYYWSKEFLAPTSIIALLDTKNNAINYTLTRDDITDYRDARVYTVTIHTYLWSELYSKKTITRQEVLESNSAQQRSIAIDTIFVEPFNASNCFLQFILSDANNKILSSTFFFPGTISNAIGMQNPDISFQLSWRYCDEDVHYTTRVVSYTLTINVKYPALFVYIEIDHPMIIKYKLSENGFVQVEPVKTIQLEFEQESKCLSISMEHVRILSMNDFMKGGSSLSGGSTSTSTKSSKSTNLGNSVT